MLRNMCLVFGALMLVSAGPVAPAALAQDDDQQVFEFETYQQVLDLYESYNYTPEAWQAGERSVPRLVLARVPERWGAEVSQEISTRQKKQMFFRALAPLALITNEVIAGERERLHTIAEQTARSPEDKDWLATLAMRYGVIDAPDAAVGPDQIAELMVRVDTIPVSLVLAQAATESGWGTSRFADQGNAIFGQWTWGEGGMTPEDQREALGDYGIKAFDTVLDSVHAYMVNLNTHHAYGELRALRAQMRADGKPVTGWDLAAGLQSYSERGQAYVDDIRGMIDHNHLEPTDYAYLIDGPTTLLVPVGEGNE